MNLASDFAAALAEHHLTFVGAPEVDDKIHRFKSGEDGEANSWYVLHDFNGLIVGAFGCWKRHVVAKWCNKDRKSLSKEEWNEASKAWKAADAARAEQEKKNFAEVRQKCQQLFAGAAPVKAHPYLKLKGVLPHGHACLSTQEITKGWLALPLQDALGTIHTAQFIADDGTKRYFYQGRKSGCFFQLSESDRGPLIIVEGYATGASVFEATGWTVICAMDCGNLIPVCRAIRDHHPLKTILIAADNDQFTDDNPGRTKANEAAKQIGGIVCYPEFSDEALAEKPTDFNDLHHHSGVGEVRRQINAAFPVCARPIGEFVVPPPGDPSELLKHRYLCRRGSLLINGPTGMGKSSFILQCFALWSNGLPCFGICPFRPLRCLLIQAENDDGDMAQMRDGIATGLGFTEAQRRIFFENVLIKDSSGITGKAFVTEVLTPLLDLYVSDLFAVDPALSFVGGDVKEQKVVGEFLRTYLNPLIFAHDCSCIMLHHTNKPHVGKEKANWANGELAYLGSGSSEWANWARAVLSIQSIGKHGIYRLHAAKRGARLGWKDDEDTLIYEKLIRHSKEKNIICWHDADPSEEFPAPLEPTEGKTGRPNTVSRIAGMNLFEFLSACPENGEGLREVSRRLEAWLASKRTDVSTPTCVRATAALVENGKLTKTGDGRYLKGPNA